MDRRQRKSREAIFEAFIQLLSKKEYNQITVGEIISLADVGRATFYAHFETKDFLLKDLCQALFDHVFVTEAGGISDQKMWSACDAPDAVFLHLFSHLQKNDNHILDLLSCPNNELFLRYFKEDLLWLVQKNAHLFASAKHPDLPQAFWEHHIAATFVETLRWWLAHKMEQTPEVITRYFFMAVGE